MTALLPIPAGERRQMLSITARTTSPFDGEALVAVRKLHQKLDRLGLQLVNVVERGLAPAGSVSSGPNPVHSSPIHRGHAARVRQCLAAVGLWNEREVDFLQSIAARRNPLTPRQAEWLLSLEQKLARRAGSDI